MGGSEVWGGDGRHRRQSVLRILIHKIWGYLIHTGMKSMELAVMTGLDHPTHKETEKQQDRGSFLQDSL